MKANRINFYLDKLTPSGLDILDELAARSAASAPNLSRWLRDTVEQERWRRSKAKPQMPWKPLLPAIAWSDAEIGGALQMLSVAAYCRFEDLSAVQFIAAAVRLITAHAAVRLRRRA